MGTGPVQVQAVCAAVLGELAGAFPTTQGRGSLAQWAGALGSLQQVIDVASAVQDAVIVQAAAIEPEVLEDGTLVESHRALGHAALDTPAIVSGVLNVSAVHAEPRVRAALRPGRRRPGRHQHRDRAGWAARRRWPPGPGHLPGRGRRRGAGRGPAAGRRHRRGRPRGALRRRRRRAPAAPLPAGADPDQPRPAGPTRPPRPRRSAGCAAGPTNPASTSGWAPSPPRTPPRPGPRSTPWPTSTSRQGCLPHHRTRPRQGPDRPGRRPRHHRHHRDHHRPRHRPPRHGHARGGGPRRERPGRRQRHGRG